MVSAASSGSQQVLTQSTLTLTSNVSAIYTIYICAHHASMQPRDNSNSNCTRINVITAFYRFIQICARCSCMGWAGDVFEYLVVFFFLSTLPIRFIQPKDILVVETNASECTGVFCVGGGSLHRRKRSKVGAVRVQFCTHTVLWREECLSHVNCLKMIVAGTNRTGNGKQTQM